MTPQTPQHQPSGGDGLLFSIAASVITIVALEGVFLAYPSWWLLVLVLFSAILATCGVIFVLLRTIDGDTRIGPISSPTPSAAKPAPARAAARPMARVARTH
jgi:hypothetical protein